MAIVRHWGGSARLDAGHESGARAPTRRAGRRRHRERQRRPNRRADTRGRAADRRGRRPGSEADAMTRSALCAAAVGVRSRGSPSALSVGYRNAGAATPNRCTQSGAWRASVSTGQPGTVRQCGRTGRAARGGAGNGLRLAGHHRNRPESGGVSASATAGTAGSADRRSTRRYVCRTDGREQPTTSFRWSVVDGTTTPICAPLT